MKRVEGKQAQLEAGGAAVDARPSGVRSGAPELRVEKEHSLSRGELQLTLASQLKGSQLRRSFKLNAEAAPFYPWKPLATDVGVADSTQEQAPLVNEELWEHYKNEQRRKGAYGHAQMLQLAASLEQTHSGYQARPEYMEAGHGSRCADS